MEIFGWKLHNRSKVLILFERCSSFYPLFPLTQLRCKPKDLMLL
jgi:hypothetical protein